MKKSLSERQRLERKVALVAGGAMGLGAVITRHLAASGALVAVVDSERAHQLSRLTETIGAAGGCCQGFVGDIGDLSALQRIVEAVVDKFDRLDVLVNNVGSLAFAPALELTGAAWDPRLAVNLKGPLFLTQCAAHQMILQGDGGSIIHVTPPNALHPSRRPTDHDASRAAWQRMSKSLALELAPHRIRVNTVTSSGSIEPPDAGMAPRGESLLTGEENPSLGRRRAERSGSPQEIAQAVRFLAGAESSYLTGGWLMADGGFPVT